MPEPSSHCWRMLAGVAGFPDRRVKPAHPLILIDQMYHPEVPRTSKLGLNSRAYIVQFLQSCNSVATVDSALGPARSSVLDKPVDHSQAHSLGNGIPMDVPNRLFGVVRVAPSPFVILAPPGLFR